VYLLILFNNFSKIHIGKWTCIAPIVSTSTTKRSDMDHTELLQIHHICLSFV